MWIILAFISAFCLGCYDISKKAALRTHRVIDVLTGSVCISAVILSVPLLLSVLCPEVMEDTLFYVPPMDRKGHLLTLLKSLIVLSSWAFAYVSLKHLPISVVSPLQATRPMWTLIGAMLIFGERLNGWQWTGVLLALGTVLLFSLYSRKVSADTPKNASIHHSINRAPADFNLGEEEELRQLYKLRSNAVIDLQFRRSERLNPYYLSLVLAILIGACSGLYDKYLMRHYDHNAVQVWYTLYQAVMMLLARYFYNFSRKVPAGTPKNTSFHHSVNPSFSSLRERLNPSFSSLCEQLPILLISVFLVISDNVYMLALQDPDSLIAVVSTIRRGGAVIGFAYGLLFLKEEDPLPKILCMAGICLGLVCLALG